MKDSTIISLLAVTWIAVAITVVGADTEITVLEKKIDAAYGDQEALMQAYQLETEQRLQEVEERLNEVERINRVQDYRMDMHRQELTDNAELFTDLLNSVEHLEEYMRSLPDNSIGVDVSEQDIRDIAALVYLEAGSSSCSYELKKAIASVIFNQMIYYGRTAQQTIYYPGAFSPANRVRRTTPDSACMMAVREVLENGTTLPRNVIAFQTGGYHRFGRPYTKIQNVYFTSM